MWFGGVLWLDKNVCSMIHVFNRVGLGEVSRSRSANPMSRLLHWWVHSWRCSKEAGPGCRKQIAGVCLYRGYLFPSLWFFSLSLCFLATIKWAVLLQALLPWCFTLESSNHGLKSFSLWIKINCSPLRYRCQVFWSSNRKLTQAVTWH